ncbi:hypothetical protein, partial [Acerihabitans sp.]|uniref:hypothetical protein n=1 Tax=Acerihabitans sp. TaxID=2811394 RepID=UPI002EDADC72
TAYGYKPGAMIYNTNPILDQVNQVNSPLGVVSIPAAQTGVRDKQAGLATTNPHPILKRSSKEAKPVGESAMPAADKYPSDPPRTDTPPLMNTMRQADKPIQAPQAAPATVVHVTVPYTPTSSQGMTPQEVGRIAANAAADELDKRQRQQRARSRSSMTYEAQP